MLNISMESSPQLTIADLSVIKDIIDVACARGTFRANEMRNVGEIYERLLSFLTAVESAEKAEIDATNPNTQGENNDS